MLPKLQCGGMNILFCFETLRIETIEGKHKLGCCGWYKQYVLMVKTYDLATFRRPEDAFLGHIYYRTVKGLLEEATVSSF